MNDHVGQEDAQPLQRGDREDQRHREALRDRAGDAARERRRCERKIRRRALEMPELGIQLRADLAQSAVLINVLKRDAGEARVLAHDRDELRGDQRMAAEIEEEIRLEGDGAARQHTLRRREQHRLGIGARRFLVIRGDDRFRKRHRFQRLAVGLAGDEARQFRNGLEPLRDHVGRQAALQLLAQVVAAMIALGSGTQKATRRSMPPSLRTTTAA